MSITYHPIDIEPEVRVLVDSLEEDREYAITRDLVAHEIIRKGGAGGPVTFYDAASGREARLAYAGDYIRAGGIELRHLRAAVRDGQATGTMTNTIRCLNTAARDARVFADLLAAHAQLVVTEQAVDEARARRDALVRQVAQTGTTSYRIAKALGVAESTIGRIITNGVR